MVLPYWIEKGTNTVWTKVNIPANSSVILTVKKNGTTQPNPEDVFEFFDDFEGAEYSEGQTITNLGTDLIGKIIHVKASYGRSGDGQFYISIDGTNVVPIYLHTNNVQTYDGSYHTIATNPTYPVSVEIIPFDTSCKRTVIGYESESYTGGYYSYTSTAGDLAVGKSGTYTWTTKVWEVYIRKYADQEPTVQVEQITTEEYRVKITNPNSYDLTDFQVGIPINGITDTDLLDIDYYTPEGIQITYDEVSNTIIVVGGTEDNPVSFTDLDLADDNNDWGVIDTDVNGNYVIDATIQVGDGITPTYFQTINTVMLFTVYGTDQPLINTKDNAVCNLLGGTKIAVLSQIDSIYEQLENIRAEIADVNSDLDEIKTDIDSINNTLANLRVDLPDSVKQMISYIFRAIKRLGI